MRKKTKENDYFAIFVEQAQCACDAVNIVAELMQNFDTFGIPDTVKRLHEVETHGDVLKRTLTEALVKEFLPPIEREDILSLANEIDDVVDNVEDILRYIYMYNILSIKPEAVEFIAVVKQSCESMRELIGEFKNFKKSDKLKGYIIDVNRLEEQGDEIYTRAIRNLYTTACDPRELLGWTGIYSIIESCCDCCEHVADAVEMAAMKNT